MKLTYATDFDPKDINAWSGLGVYYGKMLKKSGFELNYISDLGLPFSFREFLSIQYWKKVKGKIYSSRYDVAVSKKYGHIIDSLLPGGSTVISPNTVILAHAKKNLKKILYTDATFLNLLNSYSGFSNLSASCLKEAIEIDNLAINNSAILIYTSQWAANSAINDYNADPAKIFTIPFGPILTLLLVTKKYTR